MKRLRKVEGLAGRREIPCFRHEHKQLQAFESIHLFHLRIGHR